MSIKHLQFHICFLLTAFYICPAYVHSKELPVLVSISDLGEDYDGKRVVIFGWLRDIEKRRGRMGSDFMKLNVGSGSSEITVYTTHVININMMFNRVIIQGEYQVEGMFAGLLMSQFITADTVIRDWQKEHKNE